jgi:hypothetical protein
MDEMNTEAIYQKLKGNGVPPENLILVSRMPNPSPTSLRRVIDRMWQQVRGGLGPLSAWIVTRESHYFNGPGANWDQTLICYAACRDCLCWQMHVTERELV